MSPDTRISAAILCTALGLSAAILVAHSRRSGERAGAPLPAKVSSSASPHPASQQPPLRLLDTLLQETDPLTLSSKVLALAGSLQSADFPALLDRCREQHLTAAAEPMQVLLTAWAQVDPSAAAAYADGDPLAAKTVMAAWSHTAPGAPDAALAWIRAHVPEDRSGPLLAAVLPALAEEDPARAATLVPALNPAARSLVLTELAAEIAPRGASATESWLSTLTDPACHGEAVTALITASPPDQAIVWMTRFAAELERRQQQPTPQDGSMPALRVGTLFAAWERQDSRAAWAAFEKLPPGTPLHRAALDWIATSRDALADPAAALATLQRFPEELDDDLLGTLTRHTASTNPAFAARLTLLFSDSSSSILTVLSTWQKTDLPAARAWLAAHPVSESLHRYLPPALKEP